VTGSIRGVRCVAVVDDPMGGLAMASSGATRDPRPIEQAIHTPEVTPVSKGADSELESNPRWTVVVAVVLVGVCGVLAYLSTLIA